MSNQSNLIKQLGNLYLVQRSHYLIQYSEPIGYRTYTAGHVNSNGKKTKSLGDWQIEKHLNGEYTIGTFSHYFSKFISFDVDFPDEKMAKWITYNICNVLNLLKIENYYISYSGSKGFHIDIFFENLIRSDYAIRFFDLVINKAEIKEHFNGSQKVEFRVTDKQGLKLPLGIHQKTGKFCGFCLFENGLQVMSKEESYEFLFKIKKINSEIVTKILDESNERIEKKNAIKTEEAISQHKPLISYEPNEDYSIDRAINLLNEGLKIQGSRNNSLFLIGLYLKYSGLDEDECESELKEWMGKQNPNTYTTPLPQCLREIELMVKNMYEKDYNLTPVKKDLTVSFDEIKWIMENCPEKNQKLITYAMLIHSKRHANKQGVFYMVYSDIEKVTGLELSTVKRQMNKLSDLGTVEIVERNRRQKGRGLKNLPNLYKLNIEAKECNDSNSFITSSENSEEFIKCIRFYYSDSELKRILPRRQYDSLVV